VNYLCAFKMTSIYGKKNVISIDRLVFWKLHSLPTGFNKIIVIFYILYGKVDAYERHSPDNGMD